MKPKVIYSSSNKTLVGYPGVMREVANTGKDPE